jgi:hypothetical protein
LLALIVDHPNFFGANRLIYSKMFVAN